MRWESPEESQVIQRTALAHRKATFTLNTKCSHMESVYQSFPETVYTYKRSNFLQCRISRKIALATDRL